MLEKALADLNQVAKGHAAAERRVCNDEKCEAAGGRMIGVLGRRFGDVVDLVVPVGVGQLLRLLVLDLGQDQRREGRRLR